MKNLRITSDAFEHGETIPARYTCDGANVNPSLKIYGIPGETVSLALIADDPDAPSGRWAHWVVWNIPVTEQIIENSVPGEEGKNDFGKNQYSGPCPPSGVHRYFFKVYALDCELDLDSEATITTLEKAIKSHVIGAGELMGVYKHR